jgi:tRNA1(Val) A37 N6-methylase TrmN6
LTLIQRTARLPEILADLPATMGSGEVLPLAPRAGRPAATVLLRARKGGRAPFRLLASIPVHAAPRHERDGEDLSAWAMGVLRNGAALPWD